MRKYLLVSLLFFSSFSSFSKIVYVKANATGANNGTSWLNAYINLNNAITVALAGDTIKVAQGTYKPGTIPTSYFTMKDGVIVYGGYSNDTTITVRNWALYQTILSGDLGSNTSAQIILYGVNAGANTLWDGFIVEKNYGDYSKGAITTYGGQPVLKNFVIRSGYGESVYCNSSSPQYVNCVFSNNQAAWYKAALYHVANSSPKYFNCLFIQNRSWDTAAVMLNDQSSPTIINCTFYNNWSENSNVGKGTIVGKNNSNITVGNSIFFYNRTILVGGPPSESTDSLDVYLINSTATVSNTITQNYSQGTLLKVGDNPRFKDTSDVDGPDNMFFTADDGLQLTNPCSPGLNFGDNTFISGINTDILGNPRTYNNGIVDLGPYEFQAPTTSHLQVVYVNKLATGLSNGSSWTNAFTDLQQALLYCADTIKVAAGTYLPSTSNNPASSFWIPNRIVMLGGFPNTGNPTIADPQVNPTILSGKYPGNVSPARILVRSSHSDSTTLIDGFTIRDAASDQNLGVYETAGIFITNYAYPVIKNCQVTQKAINGNNAFGIIVKLNSNPRFYNCNVDSANNGGLSIDNSFARFIRCNFRNNAGGGAVVASNANYFFDSCQFIKNSTASAGSAFSNSNCIGTISNSNFVDNNAPEMGNDIYNNNSSPLFINCKLTDTSYSQFGGKIYNTNNSQPLFRFCEFSNSRAHTGGVVYNDHSAPTFISCVFNKNNSQFDGGCIFSKNYSNTTVVNCIAVGNTGYGTFMENNKSAATIVNSNFVKNGTLSSTGTGTAVIDNYDSAIINIKNSIFWENSFYASSNPVVEIANNTGSSGPSITNISNSITQVYGTNGVNGNFVGINPRMVESEDPDGLDNQFFTADDGFRLSACSPGVNTGANTATTETTDILGNPRIYNSTVDIGAYELQSAVNNISRTCFVNALATGNNDGTSWANAYTNLWSAINNSCIDTLKIAQGTYKPAFNSRDSSFKVMHGKVFLGGYPNTGSPTDANRNPSIYVTILSGNIGNQSDSADNTRSVVYVYYPDAAITFDGLTFSDGYAEFVSGNSTSTAGGGLSITQAKVTINDCKFDNNFALTGGGLASNTAWGLKISKSIFRKNKTSNKGGGFYIRTGHEEKSLIENSVAVDNIGVTQTATSGAGGYIEGATQFNDQGIDVNNVIFSNDSAYKGGGLYVSTPEKIWITNCDFVSNHCSSVGIGAGLYNDYGQFASSNQNYPKVTNSIFKQNFIGPLVGENYAGADIFDSYCPSYNCYSTYVTYTRIQTYNYGNGIGNTGQEPQLVNINDGDGPDNKWMTADDGYRLLACSPMIERGINAAVTTIPLDILGNNRIIGNTVDLGAYEFTGSPIGSPLSDNPNDTLRANKQFTTSDGWTHYYNDCIYLLSIRKNGQDIGNVGSGNFEVRVVTKPGYGSGYGMNLSSAAYNTNPGWFTMNKNWNVIPTNPVVDSILVRFPYTLKDVNDLKGSNPQLTTQQQIEFFKVSNTENPFDLSVPASNFHKYTNGTQPSLTKWQYSQLDSNFLCDYYVTGFSGGSGGTTYNGPLADLFITAQSVSPTTIPTNSSFTLNFVENNSGAYQAYPHKIYFYLSTDTVLTPGVNGDSLLGEYLIANNLAAGSNTGVLNKQLQMPCSITAGNYYILFVADGDNVIAESSETNNLVNSAIVIVTGTNTPATPTISANPGTSVCTPATVTLTANSTGCTNCTYSWSTGATGPSITVNTSGTYTVTVNNGCATSSTNQTITVNQSPTVNITTSSGPYCQNQPITFTASGANSYTWTGPGLSSTTGTVVTGTSPSAGSVVYTVTGTAANGCSSTAQTTITINSQPAVNIIQNDTTICLNSSVQLTATSNGASNNWSPTTGLSTSTGLNVTATPLITTVYTLTTSSIFNCTNKDSIKLTVVNSMVPQVNINFTGCPSATLIFQATPTNGGSIPQYQWFVNNVLSGTGNPYTLQNAINNSQVYVKMITSIPCANPASVNSQTVAVNCITTGLPSINGVEYFHYSPNPTDGNLYLQMKLNQTKQIQFIILNELGEKIYMTESVKAVGIINRQFDLSKHAAGVYYLQTIINGNSVTDKIVLVK